MDIDFSFPVKVLFKRIIGITLDADEIQIVYYWIMIYSAVKELRKIDCFGDVSSSQIFVIVPPCIVVKLSR